ncbi:hypothetical protein OEV98_14970 [Caldibacillus lycopersici]|uniref:Uncharacterized protein n=1 Tax=Perspicuibacillus lycopersici TaxID=1325689 RepID=A0AAE3LRN1_9BACI|nr:hypothetical protein [Perspicuibacillus lycopersici]MCU9614844.1 hypothetical protein [Perspicuibacillus lycopersici]
MLEKPFPLESLVSKYKEQMQENDIQPSTYKVQYLNTIESMVRYFSTCMDEVGRIIDPYMERETQYATPAYAAATALLFTQRPYEWMLESASKALDCSLRQMVNETCADGHSNFYTTMVVYAYEKLAHHVSEAKRDEWVALFSEINPKTLYQKTINNWKIVALAGEYLRDTKNLGPAINLAAFDDALAPQMELLTEYGLYVDPNGPLAYAMFTRNYLRLILLEGYAGRYKETLAECCRRGELSSLFMQSPTGEMPTGGRSAQHQWNEAQQAFQFEIAANEYAKKGDWKLAAAFKRGAHLSLDSIQRWKRPTGELNVVKNFADPSIRLGYESYSFHSQYNLLAAYFLALAYEQASEEIGEIQAPAEVGGFTIWMEPFFHKLIINVAGHYIEYQTEGDDQYTPTGIVRIQRKGIWPTIGPSDGTPVSSKRALSFAPAWKNVNNVETRLSELTGKEIPKMEVKEISKEANKIIVQVIYQGPMNGAFRIERTLSVTPEILHVADTIIGEVESVTEEFPLFFTDGEASSKISYEEKRIDVDYKGNKVCIIALDKEASDFQLGSEVVSYRNGMLTSISYESKALETEYVVHLYHHEHYLEDTTFFKMLSDYRLMNRKEVKA